MSVLKTLLGEARAKATPFQPTTEIPESDVQAAIQSVYDDAVIDAFTQSGSGAVTRTYLAKVRETCVTPQDFGAVGDGSTDDTVAIQAALTASRRVYFPPATYKITNTLTLTDNTCVYGDGWASKIQQYTRERNVFVAGSFCEIRGLHLIGDNGATGVDFTKNNAIYASEETVVRVDGCYIEKFEGCGVQLRSCKNVAITNNVFFANPWGNFASSGDIVTYSGSAGGRHLIEGNYCLSNNSQGIYLDALGYDADIICSNNQVITLDPATCVEGGAWSEVASGGVRRHGIVCGYNTSSVDGPRAVVSGNICRNTLWTGIYKHGESAGPVLITGNVCTKNGYAMPNSLSGGIYADISGHEIISDNIIDDFQNTGSGTGGITLNSVTANTEPALVANNLIMDSLGYGINITTYVALVDVRDNTITGSANIDIFVNQSAADTAVGGHRIRGNRILRTSQPIKSVRIDQQASTRICRVHDNDITGSDGTASSASNNGISFLGATGLVQVTNNRISNFYNGIYCEAYHAGRDFSSIYAGNVIESCTNGIAVSGTTAGVTVPLVDNVFISVTNRTSTASGLGGSAVGRFCTKRGLNLIGESAAIPAAGSWAVGDLVVNTSPSATAPFGWHRLTTGTGNVLNTDWQAIGGPAFSTSLVPTTSDGAALGTTALQWSDLYGATGFVWNISNGDAVVTHSTGVFTVSTGDWRVTTAGTNSASVVTVGGTQTLSSKTLSGDTPITGVATVASATATPAGGSTSARLLFGTTAGFGVYYGSGVPTVSAAQGSLYMRSDGSSTSTRMYVNTDGGTTWTNVTTAA
jgi:hypothetical protein